MLVGCQRSCFLRPAAQVMGLWGHRSTVPQRIWGGHSLPFLPGAQEAQGTGCGRSCWCCCHVLMGRTDWGGGGGGMGQSRSLGPDAHKPRSSLQASEALGHFPSTEDIIFFVCFSGRSNSHRDTSDKATLHHTIMRWVHFRYDCPHFSFPPVPSPRVPLLIINNGVFPFLLSFILPTTQFSTYFSLVSHISLVYSSRLYRQLFEDGDLLSLFFSIPKPSTTFWVHSWYSRIVCYLNEWLETVIFYRDEPWRQ